MISRLIFITGLVLLFFSIVSGIYLFWLLPSPKPAFEIIPLHQPLGCISGCGTSSSSGPSTISESGPSHLVILGELPKQMDSGISDTIEVNLTFFSSLLVGKPLPTSNNVRTILYPEISPVLDNDVVKYCSLHNTSRQQFINCYSDPPAVKNLFGPGYELFASAHLVATGFEVQLLDATEQSVDQRSIEWDWNISPKSADVQSLNQSINLNVDLHWKPLGNSGKEDIFRQIWEDNLIVTVNPPPFIARGQLTISTFLAGLAGIIASIIIAVFSKILEKNKDNTPKDTQRERLEELVKRERLEREKVERELSRERLEQKRKRERLEQKRKRERLQRERFLSP